MIVNIILQWNVWDYSNVPFNVMGQICLPFSIIWFFLSLPAIVPADIYLERISLITFWPSLIDFLNNDKLTSSKEFSL